MQDLKDRVGHISVSLPGNLAPFLKNDRREEDEVPTRRGWLIPQCWLWCSRRKAFDQKISVSHVTVHRCIFQWRDNTTALPVPSSWITDRSVEVCSLLFAYMLQSCMWSQVFLLRSSLLPRLCVGKASLLQIMLNSTLTIDDWRDPLNTSPNQTSKALMTSLLWQNTRNALLYYRHCWISACQMRYHKSLVNHTCSQLAASLQPAGC